MEGLFVRGKSLRYPQSRFKNIVGVAGLGRNTQRCIVGKRSLFRHRGRLSSYIALSFSISFFHSLKVVDTIDSNDDVSILNESRTAQQLSLPKRMTAQGADGHRTTTAVGRPRRRARVHDGFPRRGNLGEGHTDSRVGGDRDRQDETRRGIQDDGRIHWMSLPHGVLSARFSKPIHAILGSVPALHCSQNRGHALPSPDKE